MSDPMLPFERTSEESREAALKQMNKLGKTGRDRSRIYEAIRRHPDGLTDEEGQSYTGILANTYRPRRGELAEAGLIRKSGAKRRTRAGSPAAVWEAS